MTFISWLWCGHSHMATLYEHGNVYIVLYIMGRRGSNNGNYKPPVCMKSDSLLMGYEGKVFKWNNVAKLNQVSFFLSRWFVSVAVASDSGKAAICSVTSPALVAIAAVFTVGAIRGLIYKTTHTVKSTVLFQYCILWAKMYPTSYVCMEVCCCRTGIQPTWHAKLTASLMY